MPAEKGDKQAVTIWIKKDLVTKIDALAEKGDLTRSKLISNLVEVGVEELTIMNKVGIWAMAKIYEDIRQRLRGRKGKKDEGTKEEHS
jgi:metal-responsive CopG/Arc/MetJ family transcriptional regulator